MDFGAIYHFLFETFAGMGILSIVACIIMEWNTRRKFEDRGEPEEDDDEWSFFDDEDDDN